MTARGFTSYTAASKHAIHQWACPGCGKVCRGNGGKSSHSRSCLPLARHRYVKLGRLLATETSKYDIIQRTRENDFERLRQRLLAAGGDQ